MLGRQSIVANGYISLGGIIFQWGTFDPHGGPDPFPVTFPLTFPANVFNIQTTFVVDNNSTFRNAISTVGITTAGFSWEGSITSHIKTVYFFAIGN